MRDSEKHGLQREKGLILPQRLATSRIFFLALSIFKVYQGCRGTGAQPESLRYA